MLASLAAALVCVPCVLVGPSGVSTMATASADCNVVVTIPAIDMNEELRYYRGSPDDAPGTRIQDRGDLASPLGPRGGVRAGEVGNFFIAGHRTTGRAPLKHLRALRPGDVVTVRTRCGSGSARALTYVITRKSRYVDFFTRKGRAAQIAPVPFRPGELPTQPMITLSTCATQEDNARGDRRRDQFGNPPGRWVVTGVLQSAAGE